MVELEEEKLIFKGKSRDVYILDEQWCIKVVTKKNGSDNCNALELKNFQTLKVTSLSNYIPQIQDKLVETSLGYGICCELVYDYDGARSKSLLSFYQDCKFSPFLREQFDIFFNICETENIFIYDLNPYNFLIQQVSPDNYQIKFVDIKSVNDSKTFFDLEKWIKFFARQKFKRRKKCFYDKWLK